MAFGSKKQAVIAKPSFKERLTGVKSMFKKAHEDASKLNAEMQADIDSKKQKVKLLEDEIGFISEEDKKDGTLGIRTIFEGIKSSEVFTVVFQKQDKAKTKKQYEAEREAQRQEAVALIDKAKKAKKSMAVAYKEALEHIQNNPIKDFIEGEDRVLRGYKMQFVSRDGKYKCMDMDVVRGPKETGERLVNINTIKQLIFNGVKYVVE